MAADDRPSRSRRARSPSRRARRKALTIGAVCKALEQEFPDISISKIRYLEDQKLLTPRRTPGGYRLYCAGRRRAAAHDPAPAARRVPAAAGDPPGARRRAAPSDRASPARRAGGRRRAPGAALRRLTFATARPRRAVLARGRARGDGRRPAARRRARGLRRSSRARRATGDEATTTRPSARSSAPSPSWRASASAGATCACSAPPPTARPALLAADPRPGAALAQPGAAQGGGRGAREPRRRSPRTSSTCC